MCQRQPATVDDNRRTSHVCETDIIVWCVNREMLTGPFFACRALFFSSSPLIRSASTAYVLRVLLTSFDRIWWNLKLKNLTTHSDDKMNLYLSSIRSIQLHANPHNSQFRKSLCAAVALVHTPRRRCTISSGHFLHLTFNLMNIVWSWSLVVCDVYASPFGGYLVKYSRTDKS